MKHQNWVHALALTLALVLAGVGAYVGQDRQQRAPEILQAGPASARSEASLQDRRGQRLAPANYRRIVALEPQLALLLPRIIAPSRIAALPSYVIEQHPHGFAMPPVARINSSAQIEKILELEPDLVLVSSLSDPATLARLHERSIPTFDLGGPSGIAKAIQDLHTLGALLQVPQRAASVAAQLATRRFALETACASKPSQSGIYLTRYGDRFFGASTGSSQAEILRLGCVQDLAAAKGYKEWPSYSLEQLAALNPELIVTSHGQGASLCQHAGLAKLSACQSGGKVVQLPKGLDSDGAFGLLDAAAALACALHPSLRRVLGGAVR